MLRDGRLTSLALSLSILAAPMKIRDLDRIDRQILASLQRDGRMTN